MAHKSQGFLHGFMTFILSSWGFQRVAMGFKGGRAPESLANVKEAPCGPLKAGPLPSKAP